MTDQESTHSIFTLIFATTICLAVLGFVIVGFREAEKNVSKDQEIIEMLPKILRAEDNITASISCKKSGADNEYTIVVDGFNIVSRSKQDILITLQYPEFGSRVRSKKTYSIEPPVSSIETITYNINSDRPPVIIKFIDDLSQQLQHGQKIIADPFSFKLVLYNLPVVGCRATVFTKCGVENSEMHFKKDDLKDNINICGTGLDVRIEIDDSCSNAQLSVKLLSTPKTFLGLEDKGEELRLSFWKKPTEDTQNCWKSNLVSMTDRCKDQFLGGASVYVPTSKYSTCYS